MAIAIGLAPTPAAIVATGIVLSAVHHTRIALQRSRSAIVGLSVSADGAVEIESRGGTWLGATLQAAIVPANWLAVLIVRDSAGHRRALLILPDGIDAAVFRRLRVWLLWRSATIPHSRADAPNLR